MVIPGKPNLEIQLYHPKYLSDLEIFLGKCKQLGLENNKDTEAIKLKKIQMPYGQYFIGWDKNKKCIWNLAGVHCIPEFGENTWRVLFRGAQLPGYTCKFGTDFLRISYHWKFFLPLQINFIQERYENPKFIISTNINNKSAGKSDRLNKRIMPQLAKRGIISLLTENYVLYNTLQNIWSIKTNNLIQALTQN